MTKYVPYQIFFPIGIFCALLSVGIWIVDDLFQLNSPTMFIHSKLAAGGFLWSFITGFLMTAVPKLTGTNSATKIEVGLASLFLLQIVLYSFVINSSWFYFAMMTLVAFLIFFAGRRLIQHTKKLPVFISHIVLGLVLACLGAYYHATGNHLMGLHLYHIGTILLLVLGIGTRFFSFLSGLPSSFEAESSRILTPLFHIAGLSIAILLYIAGTGVQSAYFVIFIITLYYLFFVWKIFRKSNRASTLKYAVRIVALMIPLTFLLCWLLPEYRLTWLHFLFIGCFTLITFSVSTRVILAHGSYSTDLETKISTLWPFLTLLVISLIFRISYGLVYTNFRDYLLYSAVIFWLAAILTWSFSFFFKIFVPGPQSKPSC